jgi:hypothetical protein
VVSSYGENTCIKCFILKYLYTTNVGNIVDGWLQQVAEYEDSTKCTNMAGPRRGVQFIIADNGVLMDMRNEFTQYGAFS